MKIRLAVPYEAYVEVALPPERVAELFAKRLDQVEKASVEYDKLANGLTDPFVARAPTDKVVERVSKLLDDLDRRMAIIEGAVTLAEALVPPKEPLP